jgi:hypothetical protein
MLMIHIVFRASFTLTFGFEDEDVSEWFVEFGVQNCIVGEATTHDHIFRTDSLGCYAISIVEGHARIDSWRILPH